jgi:hypothetical protein
MFTLRFDLKEVHDFANRYPVEDDHQIEMVIAPRFA